MMHLSQDGDDLPRLQRRYLGGSKYVGKDIESLGEWSKNFLWHIHLSVFKNTDSWGTWVAQPMKRPTLSFSSGHDTMVHEIEPRVGLRADSEESA